MIHISETLRAKLKRVPLLYQIGHGIHQLQYALIERGKRKRLAKRGLATVQSLLRAFKEEGLPVFLTYGTLLGVLRAGGLMRHDNDVDFGLLLEDETVLPRLLRLMRELGARAERHFIFAGQVCELAYELNGIGIDFFIHRDEGEESRSYWFRRSADKDYPDVQAYTPVRMHTPAVRQVRWLEQGGLIWSYPSDPEGTMAAIYGESWRIPDPAWKSGSGPACQPLDEELARELPGEFVLPAALS